LLYAIGRLRLLPRPLPTWVATVALFVAYVVPAAALLLYVVHFAAARVIPILFPLPWLSDGIAISLMLLWGTRTWPGVFLGSICIWGVVRGDPAILVGVDAIGETLSVVIAVKIMRALHFRRQLDRLADPLILFAAALAGRCVAAVADIIGTVTGAVLTPHSLPKEYMDMVTAPGSVTPTVTTALVFGMLRWQINALSGIALTVPALLTNPRRLRHALRTRALRLMTLCALSVLWCGVALGLSYPSASWGLLLSALMLVAWAAIDFGALTAALCTLLFSCVAAAAFIQDVGPLASADVLGSLAATWGFIGLLCCASPVLGVLLSARHHHDRRLTVLAERYRSLFTANPTPAWVADAVSGNILMANAEAVRRYGFSESEFLHMTISELVADSGPGTEPPRPEGTLVAAPLIKHLTRDGRPIDVELVSTPLELDGRAVNLLYAVDMTDHQDLRRRLIATVDRESCRLSQELHDGLGQILAGLAIGSETLLQRTGGAQSLEPSAVAQLRELTDHAQHAESSLYQLTTGVSPLEELHGDLLEALRRLPSTLPAAERARVEVVVEHAAPVTLSLERREHLYRVVQEALANALKHAHADHILIRAQIDRQRIAVAVEDNGVGIRDLHAAGLGLQSMKLRAGAAGAELRLSSLPDGGTAVTCSCPQAEPAAVPATPRNVLRARRSLDAQAGPPPSLAPLATATLIVLACWIGGLLSHFLASAQNVGFSYADARLAVPSLLAGAAICSLLARGRQYWPAVFAGLALSRFTVMGEPFVTALLMGAMATVSTYALVGMLERWRFTPSFDRWQDPLVLCAAGVIAVTPLSILGAGLLALLLTIGSDHVAPGVGRLFSSPHVPGISFTPALGAAMVRWWFDQLAGMVLLVPTMTLLTALRRAVRSSLAELCAWFACVAAGVLTLLTVSTERVLMPLLALGILLVVWAAARLGVALASVATLILAMAAAASFETRTGALGTQDATTGVLYVWGFVGVMTVIGFFLAALLAEHNSRHSKIAAVSQRYRRLFQGDPRPLWLHDTRTGEILDANDAAAQAYGYSIEEFSTLNVAQLLAPGATREQLVTESDRAVGPFTMKHLRKGGETLDVEMWFYGTFVDGRRVSICFAHDVTERNTLRRLLFDKAELDSRQLAAELRRTLAAPLAELRIVAHKVLLELSRQGTPARMRELLESLARQARRAAQSCREVAHRLSPLQANRGDLVAALEALRSQVPESAPLEIDVSGDAPLMLRPDQSEQIYGLLSEIVTHCPASRRGNVVRVVIATFSHMLRVSVDTELPPASPAGPGSSLARHPSVLLRARAMGARLWEFSLGGARTRVVCDYPL
jgi:PAS domain S-box-containing protein